MNAPIRPPSPENASPQQIFRAILATDFRAFVEYVFGLLRPGTPFKPNWHIDAMAHKVSQVASGDIKRLIITVPPRHLKSIIASVALPAWYLGHNPSERVVCVSYSAELAKTHANDFRRVVTRSGLSGGLPEDASGPRDRQRNPYHLARTALCHLDRGDVDRTRRQSHYHRRPAQAGRRRIRCQPPARDRMVPLDPVDPAGRQADRPNRSS